MPVAGVDHYGVFTVVERSRGIITLGTHKDRCRTLWQNVRSCWSRDMTRRDMLQELDRSRKLLQILRESVFADHYLQGSKARWLLTLKTLVRVQCGLLAALLFSARKHVNLILRVAPVALHVLAVLVQNNGGTWSCSFLPLLNGLLRPLEVLALNSSAEAGGTWCRRDLRKATRLETSSSGGGSLTAMVE